MEKIKTKMLVGGLAMAIAGSAAAIPMTWTRTFEIYGDEQGVFSNLPLGQSVQYDTLWTYAPDSNDKNQMTTITLGSSDGFGYRNGTGDTLTPNNKGNPVVYSLTGISITGMNESQIVFGGDGYNILQHIKGTVTLGADPTNDTSFVPFDNVGTCLGGPGMYYTLAYFTGPSDPSDGTWTGVCAGGPYTSGIYPNVDDLAKDAVTQTVVVDEMTQFHLFFWDEQDPNITVPEVSPDAKMINLTVTFSGVCTSNCTTEAMPVPATLALLGFGLVGMGAAKRRKPD